MKKNLLLILLFFAFKTVSYGQTTESFSTAPTLIDYPGYPAWKQIAEVTISGVVYQISNGGNGGWAYATTGGASNSANIAYSTGATTNVTIKRKDNQSFKFYGVWLKYNCSEDATFYPPPHLTVSYQGSTVIPNDVYAPKTTQTTLVKNLTVTQVNLSFVGLIDLNFDDLIVGALPTPLTATTGKSDVLCYGSATGSASVTASGGTGPYTYSWSPSGGSAATASGLTAGSYTCTIKDAVNASITRTVNVGQPATEITATLGTVNPVTCNGSATGSATVNASGGTGTLTYAWSPRGGVGATATGLIAGDYTCTVTDINLCSKQVSVTINEPSAITATISATNVSSPGGTNGTATVVASGGTGPYTYLWSPGGSTTATASGLSAGNYTCYITDSKGCTLTKNVSVTQSVALSNFSAINKTYGDPIFTLTNPTSASGGAFTYSSSNTGVATVNGNSITIIKPGTTTIVATQAANGTYSSGSISAVLTVAVKDISLSLNATPALSKTYDGTTNILLAAGNYQLNGVVNNDDVHVSATASYDTKKVGTSKTITANNFVVTGSVKQYYNLTNTTATTTGTITTKALTASAAAVTKVYDGAATATLSFNAFNTAAGLVGTDDVALTYTSATYSDKNVANGKIITITGLSLTGTERNNYALNAFSTTGAITAKPITASGAAQSKVYDGTTAATISFDAMAAANGLVTGDDVSAVYTSAVFDTKNVGANKAITITGLALSGAQKNNYSLNAFSTTASITSKAIIASAAAVTKVYDGTNAATLNFSALSGLVPGDQLSVTYTSAAYNDKNVGANKAIAITGLALSGAQKDNYILNAFTTTGAITAKALTASAASVTKVYDGATTATLNFNAFNNASGLVGTDDVALTYTSATYNDKNVGANKAIAITGLSLTGAELSNYSLNAFSTTGAITAKPITASAAAVSKIYDGNTAATISFDAMAAANGLVTGDDVSAVYTSAAYDTKNVGVNKAITINGLALSGAQKNNYSLNAFSTTGAITGKAITASAASVTKVYDGTAVATLSFNALNSGSGLATGDQVAVTYTSAAYNDKNAGTNKAIAITGLALSGAQKDNYTLNAFTTTGAITAKALTASAAPVTKVYDGTTTATLNFNAFNNASGLVGTDDVALTYTGATYNDKNVANGKAIAITGLTLTGTERNNYSLNAFSTTGAITAKPITATAAVVSKIYDGNTTATISFDAMATANGLVTGDDVSAVYTSATYDTKNVGANKAITINGLALSGAQKNNYSLNAFSTTGAITGKTITASAAAVTKVYDGTAAATLNFNALDGASGLATGDQVAVTYTSAAYNDKNVGANKAISINGLALSGAQKDNYTLNAFTTTGAITAKALTASAAPVTKVYDGTTTATLSFNAFNSAAGLVGADDVALTYTSANYNDKNVANGKAIAITGLTLTGTERNNYSLNAFSTTGAITAKPITASAAAVSKIYDGNTTATITFDAMATANGLVTGDDVSAVYTSAAYDTKNVGVNKAITINGLALSGAQKSNYSLNAFSTTGAITGKAITASAAVVSKVYDGTAVATLSFNALNSGSGLTTGDQVSVTYTSAAYNDKNVGSNKAIAITGLALSGAQKDNYTLNAFTTTGAVTAKALTASVAPVTKVYDGATTATLNFNAFNSASGLVGTDQVALAYTSATYNDKNVATGKAIAITGLSLTGTERNNYSLNAFSTTGAITAKGLIITADHKEKFAGTANPALTASYNGFIAGESNTVLTTQPSLITAANVASPIGDYDINVSGAVGANYAITYVKGTLTVKPGAPNSLVLTSVTLYENLPAGTNAGTLSSTSDDPSATFTYTLVAGTGATDNASFAIVGNKLNTTASLDYESKSVYKVRVRTTTQYGLFLEKELTINLTDVNEVPTLAAISNQTICYTTAAQSVGLTGISAGPETAQTTSLSVSSNNASLFNGLTVSGSGTTGTLSYSVKSGASGTATVTVTVKDNGGVANGGVDSYSRSFVITVNPLPVIAINSDKGAEVSKGETVFLTATGGVSYEWSNATGVVKGLTTAVLEVRPNVTTTYTVTATNGSGCKDTKTFTLTVLDDLVKINAKNILTPNGDGYNDLWIVDNIDFYPNNQVKVFDRAGRVIYAKKGYDNTWDGMVNGKALDEGTYYYIIDFGVDRRVFKGFITVLRTK